MSENLDGMSAEQLMLRDVIYELNDLVDDAANNPDSSYRFGVYSVVSLLARQLDVFEIDQTRFARQMPDVEKLI